MKSFIVQVYNQGIVIPIAIEAKDADEASRLIEKRLTAGRVLSVVIPREKGA